MMLTNRIWLLLAITLGMLPSASPAQIIVSGPLPAPSGFTDGKTPVTLTTTVNVGTDTEVKGLVLDPQPLNGPDGLVVDRSNIKLVALVNLAEHTQVPVTIAISGLVKPGHYQGSFVLRAPQPGSGVPVPLTVDLKAKALVSLSSDGLASYSCLWSWSCKAAEKWIPAKKTIAIDNKGMSPAELTPAGIILRATRGSGVLKETELNPTVDVNPVKPPGGVIRLTIPDDLPADRYKGFLAVGVKDGDDLITTPVALDVKHGPWIAILLLALGIVLGRFVQSRNTPRAQAQQRLFGILAILQKSESDVKDFAMARLLSETIDDARGAIGKMIQSEAELTEQLKNISGAIDLANHIERLQDAAQQVPDDKRAEFDADLTAARTAFLGKKFDDAETARATAEQILLSSLGQPGVSMARTARTAPTVPAFALVSATRPPMLRTLQWIAGSQPTAAEVKFAFAQPILFGLLFMGLLVVGIYTLYVKNTTFGADIVFDYFSLLTWGLSADVAQRTLQNLQISK